MITKDLMLAAPIGDYEHVFEGVQLPVTFTRDNQGGACPFVWLVDVSLIFVAQL